MMIRPKIDLAGLKRFGAEVMQQAAVEIEAQLREQWGGIVDPATGERPRLVFTGRFPDWQIEFEGSDSLLAIVAHRLAAEGATADVPEAALPPISQSKPYVFISHASEDQTLAEQLARGLGASGIETFIDSDDITGDASFAAGINKALATCTHFVALLTPVAVSKPWVKHELLVITSRVVKGEVAFFALATHGYTATMFQKQFATLAHVPFKQFTDVKEILLQLVSDILALARKPANGPLPLVATKPDGHGLSKAAYALAEWLITRSGKGQDFDPQVEVGDELRLALGLSQLDLEDAITELKSLGCVRSHPSTGSWRLTTKAELFARFDQHFMDWSPEADARRIAARLMAETDRGTSMRSEALATEFDWTPRRTNPAITWLKMRNLISGRENGIGNYPFVQLSLIPNAQTRQFVSFDPHMPQKSLGSP